MKKDRNNLGLDSKAISALPIINRFIERIELKELLSQHIPSKENQKLSHADSILLFVRNILIEREPLYKLSEWEALRRITGRSDFIYVSDSKLCTREQMTYIAKEGGRFISVLPETRKECEWFKTWFRSHNVNWEELLRRPDHRRPESREHVYWGYESPMASDEGYRIIWISSSQKQEQDAQNRQRKIEKTIKALDTLKGKVGTWNMEDEKTDRKGCRRYFQEKSIGTLV